MTTLLQKAFAEASKLPVEEQDVLAERLLTELAAEEAFDQAIMTGGTKLASLSRQTLEDLRANRMEELDPDTL